MIIVQLFALAVALQGLPQQSPSGAIDGVVVRLGSSAPIAGAHVELSRVEAVTDSSPPIAAAQANRTGPPSVFTFTTGATGHFIFQDLPEGRYRLVATSSGSGLVPAEYGQRYPGERGAVITLGTGQRLADLRLSMSPAGVITGRVFEAGGEPVGNARVMALEPTYRDGRRLLNIVQAVRTNDLGEYRLFWLRPGTYYVAAKREDLRTFWFSVYINSPERSGAREDASTPIVRERVLEDGTVIEEVDVLVYHGGGIDPNGARAIDVQPGATIAAVDIPADDATVRAFRMKGVAVDASTGQPAAGAQLRLVPREPGPHVLVPAGNAGPQGEFELRGVLPGSYILSAASSGGVAFSAYESWLSVSNGTVGFLPIDAGSEDMENVTIVLKPGFHLPGQLYLEGSASTADWDITSARVVSTFDPDVPALPRLRSSPVPGQRPSGAPSEDGVFTLMDLGPGRYRVNVLGLPQNEYVKAMRLGMTDVLTTGFQADPAPEGQLDILINLDGGMLEGLTVDDRSEPVGNATIVLVPDVLRRAHGHAYKVGSSDASGRFEIQGIPPGEYSVFSWESVVSGAWRDPEFLAIYGARGTPVRIGEGGLRQLRLTVLPRVR